MVQTVDRTAMYHPCFGASVCRPSKSSEPANMTWDASQHLAHKPSKGAACTQADAYAAGLTSAVGAVAGSLGTAASAAAGDGLAVERLRCLRLRAFAASASMSLPAAAPFSPRCLPRFPLHERVAELLGRSTMNSNIRIQTECLEPRSRNSARCPALWTYSLLLSLDIATLDIAFLA